MELSSDLSGGRLHQSLKIHHAKEICITDLICNSEYGDWENGECRFTVYRVTIECDSFNPSLRDPKIAKRHLDAQVRMGVLDVDVSRGKTEYIYRKNYRSPSTRFQDKNII